MYSVPKLTFTETQKNPEAGIVKLVVGAGFTFFFACNFSRRTALLEIL